MDDPDAGRGPGWPGARLVHDGLLWTGGIATAMVAALVTLTGAVIARGILQVPLIVPTATGGWGEVSAATYLGTGAYTLAATALLYGLLVAAPQPFLFFGWTMGLATLVMGLMPLAAHTSTPSAAISIAVNLSVCGAVWSLLVAVGHACVAGGGASVTPRG